MDKGVVRSDGRVDDRIDKVVLRWVGHVERIELLRESM